jgi:hypothetical protein
MATAWMVFKLKNAPAETLSWLPIIYQAGLDYHPVDDFGNTTPLTPNGQWQVSVNTTPDIIFRCHLTLDGGSTLNKDINTLFTPTDGTYTFDWATGALGGGGNTLWLVAGTIGAVALFMLLRRK